MSKILDEVISSNQKYVATFTMSRLAGSSKLKKLQRLVL